MKILFIVLFFVHSLYGFKVKFFDGKYHIKFKIDKTSPATIICEDEDIDIKLEKGEYDIALDCRPLKMIYDKNSTKVHKNLLNPIKAIRVPKNLSFEKIMDEIKNKKVIFVGENHDRLSHHLNQLKVIKSMHNRGKKIAIGMEMFQRKFQPVLDDYIHDKIKLKKFLKKSEYFKRWGYDYNLYKPIIDYAKENKIPIIALNLERELTKKISKDGLSSLSKEDRAKLPQTIDFSNKEYKEKLLKFFSSNTHMVKSKKKNLEFIYQSQILWDQTMADTVNKYLDTHEDTMMVVLAGSGHVEFGYGIPDHVTYTKTIILQDEEAKPKSANFILFTDSIDTQKSLKLGVGLEFTKLRVTEVSKDSLAKKLGLKKGDLIIKIDGQSINDISELKLELFFKKPDKPISITYKRDKKIITQSSK